MSKKLVEVVSAVLFVMGLGVNILAVVVGVPALMILGWCAVVAAFALPRTDIDMKGGK